MQRPARLFAVGACLFLAVVAATPLASSQVFGPDRDQIADGDFNGIEAHEVATLWSRDVEGDPATQQKVYADLLEWAGADREDVEDTDDRGEWESTYDIEEQRMLTNLAVALNGEYTSGSPPKAAHQWTRDAAGDLEAFGFDDDSSVHPQHADLQDDDHVEDAHATIFGVTNSTYYHTANYEDRSDVPLYVAPGGEVTALVDYRVEDRSGWTLDSHEIEEIRLEVDGREVDDVHDVHQPTLSFGGLPEEESVTLRVEADIEAEWYDYDTETEQVQVGTEQVQVGTRTICPDNLPTYVDQDCYEVPVYEQQPVYEERTTREREEDDETVTVSDEIEVRPYRLEPDDVQGWVAEKPDGETLVRVGVEDRPWAGYTAHRSSGPPDRVQSNTRFYAARDESWDQITVATESGGDTYDSPARPVWVHAYQASAGPAALDPQIDYEDDTPSRHRSAPTEVRAWGPTRTPTVEDDHGIGSAVTVRQRLRDYTEADVLGATHASWPDAEAVRVRGIVGGQTVEADLGSDTFRERPVSTVQFDVSDETRGREATAVEVQLQAEDGTSLMLSGDDPASGTDDPKGQLVLRNENETVIDDAGRTAEGVVAGRGTYGVTYEPSGWQTMDPRDEWGGRVYVGHAESHVAGGLTGDRLPELLATFVFASLPFAVLYYSGARFARLFEFTRR